MPESSTGPVLHYSEKYIELLRCGDSELMISRILKPGCENGGQYGWGAVTVVEATAR